MPTQSDVSTQLAAFSQAPIPYIAEATLVAALIWFLARSINKGAVDALRERLNLAIDRLRAANDEAETVRRHLDDLRGALPTVAADARAEASTTSAETGVRQLIQGNTRTLEFLSGETPARPLSSSGPASEPEARR